MRCHWWRIAAFVVPLGCFTADDVLACSCVRSGPACQAAWDADVVFAGTVRSIDRVDHTDAQGYQYPAQIVHLDVEQPFINAAAPRMEVLSNPLNTCDYRGFKVGGKYLVYAKGSSTSGFRVSICSRTRPLLEAAADLQYLMTLSTASTGARVFGRVNEWARDPAEERGIDYGPVEDLVVTVRGATFLRDVITDKRGQYELSGVPLGRISISAATPFGFRSVSAREFEIKDLRACVESDFTIAAEAEASGTVVDASGRPVSGVVVDAVASELAGYQPKAFQQPVRTDERGVFTFENLPPGSYVFGINLTKALRPSGRPVFLPGTPVAREASIFELKAGDRKDVGVLRLVER